MKIRADEHVAPRLLQEIREKALSDPGWDLSHVRDDHGPKTGDEAWITRFANDGGNGILSADRTMLKRPTLVELVRKSGLVAIYLPSSWARQPLPIQASRLINWWPKLERKYEEAGPGTIWLIPGGSTGGIREYKDLNSR